MGGKASKVARAAGSGAKGSTRKYPSRPSPAAPTSRTSAVPGAGPTVHPPPQAEFGKSEAIRQDAADPDFQSMLKTVGAVQIHDAARSVDVQQMTNPQLRTLLQRQKLADEQQEELSNPDTRTKRSWVDAGTIRQILRMRDQAGWDDKKIESQLGLADGVVKRLGSRVTNTQS